MPGCLNFHTQHTIRLNSPRSRNAVDLCTLENLLRSTATKGKKRSAATDDQRSRKRMRVGTALDQQSTEDTTAEDSDGGERPYVYRHVFRLYLISSVPPDGDDGDGTDGDDEANPFSEHAEWGVFEGRIKSLLANYVGGNTFAVDLGEVRIEAHKPRERNAAPSLRVYSLREPRFYTVQLGEMDESSDSADYDLRAMHLTHLLYAFEALSRDGRADISARLYVDVHDSAVPKIEDGMLPLTLRLEVQAALVYSKLLQPFSPLVRGHPSEVEEAQRRILLQYFPYSLPPPSFQGSVDIPFLYSTISPAPRLSTPEQEALVQPEELLPTLLPFQRRSVAWMLAREGKTMDADGTAIDSLALRTPPLFWDEVEAGGEKFYLNRVQGVLSREKPQNDTGSLGGILAEEPGLGKTLECIALILLNPSVGRSPANKRWDPEAKVHVKETKTTLIVTPASLAQQWADELALHAPSLKVLVYDGWSKVQMPLTEAAAKKRREAQAAANSKRSKAVPRNSRKPGSRAPSAVPGRGKRAPTVDADTNIDQDDGDIPSDDWCSYVNEFDVCITTYNVLQHDLRVARAPPTRPRRANVTYSQEERARSPLIMCEWYRVIMDEVQMVGGGQAEEMVSLIPRLSSFAVSGTPARAQIADLVHVLRFLRIRAIMENSRIWPRILKAPYVNEFINLFGQYSIRTVKAVVKHELTIPKQTRYLVPIELGRVERHVYDQTFDRALLALGLDARGVAVRADWEVDTADLRTWLRKLRGLCTHPQVGQLLNAGDRLHKPGVLKSMEEVLEGMKEQNWRTLMEDRRNKIQLMSTMAQLRQHQEDEESRYRSALDILLAAEKEANQLIDDIKAALDVHSEKGAAFKAQAAARLRAQRRVRTEKGKGRATAIADDCEDGSDDDQGLPQNPAGEEHSSETLALQLRLRETRISLHKIHFLKGDVYHVLGEGDADNERVSYETAEDLRRLLLQGTEETAARAMTLLTDDTSIKALKEAEMHIQIPVCEPGGIRSADLIEELHEIITGLLNTQSTLLWKWRTTLIELLTKPLTNADDVDGQEYARSLDTQGEAEAYLQAYAALLADRRESLTAERTLLAAHDVRETNARQTKAALRALQWTDEIELEKLDEEEQRPEHEVLLKTLHEERKALLEEFDSERAVRSVLVDLNNVVARIVKDTDPEKVLARDAATKIRKLLVDQNKFMEKLQADLTRLRKAFNERISYFKQLQEISDTVMEATWEDSVDAALADITREQADLQKKIDVGRARQRYLEHLAESQHEGEVDDDERCCVLCRCDFVRGYLTSCAHVFCEVCLKEWLSRKEGKVCPVCRVPINSNELQRFSLRSTANPTPGAPPIIRNDEVIPRSLRQIDYNCIPPSLLEDIQIMESIGSYGSKIDTLTRHLLYLKLSEPGAKSIVFSAWADSLLIIQHALTQNGISCLRIDQQKGKQHAAKRFRSDPDISVLLLHGERENAGLNVTCASRVFLVESVVHHAFEIQAIARIDRMGQTKPTEVYCYFAEDTVERNILDLAVRQGQSLYTKENAAGTLDASALTAGLENNTVDSPMKKKAQQKGDFVFKTDDMLAIFFPHLFEDVEYLISAEESTNMPTRTSGQSSQPVNASAGPSRLPL